MKYAFFFPISLILVSAVHSGDDKADAKAMDGTWTPASAELAGAKFPEELTKVMKMILKDNNYTVLVGDKKDQGTFKLDATKKPRHIDVTGVEGPNKGKTYFAIYELTPDSLKVCYDLSGNARPTEFKTAEKTQLFLVTYKREK